MPDHLNLLWLGTAAAADQRLAVQFFRRYSNLLLAPERLQKQAYDHVLGEDERTQEEFGAICEYILLNPVRAKLVTQRDHYKFSGAVIPGYPQLGPGQVDYWEKFWPIYKSLVDGRGMR